MMHPTLLTRGILAAAVVFALVAAVDASGSAMPETAQSGTGDMPVNLEDHAGRSTRSRAFPAAADDAIVLSGAGGASTATKVFEVFVYDAEVRLLYDDDGDGFFHGLEVRFDADTTEFASTVYARLFLRRQGEPWTMYFQTPAFSLFGTSPDDDYFVVTELLSGYERDRYDLMIEFFEFGSDAFLAQFGPRDSSALGQLPLEAYSLDRLAGTGDAFSYSGGGGSMGLLPLAVLSLLGVCAHFGKRGSRNGRQFG
jgi:hypothetical protein